MQVRRAYPEEAAIVVPVLGAAAAVHRFEFDLCS
jgi:hypothetical protein